MPRKASSINIAGNDYPLLPEEGLQVVYRSTFAERRDVAGADRRSDTLENDVLRWRWDNWQGGEGQDWIDSDREGSFTKYRTSDAAVDLDRNGKLRLGLRLSEDLASTAMTTNPFLGVARDQVIVAYDQAVQRKATYSGGDGNWDAVTLTASVHDSNIRGPFSVVGNKMFLGNANNLIRIAVSAGADGPGTWTTVAWNTTGGQMPVFANKLVFWTEDGTSKVDLYSMSPTTSGGTPDNAGTASGVDETMAMCADGPNVYVAFSKDGERGHLYKYGWNPAAGETALFEWAEVPMAFRFQNNLRSALVALNRVIFMGGYVYDSDTNLADPALYWFTDEGMGLVGRIRRGGSSEKIKAMFAGPDDKVVMGTTLGRVFAYDMARGGFYQMCSGLTSSDDISSITFHEGRYYVAVKNGSNGFVYSTLATGTNKYPASVKVTSSKWHFDIADEEKLPTSIRISHSALAAGEKVAISLELDDGTEITTDSAGATMENDVDNSTHKTFTLTDADTESGRTFRWARMNVTLTAGTNSATTPTLNFVELRAMAMSRTKYIIAKVDLSDDHNTSSPKLSGAQMGTTLRALIENTADRVFTVKSNYSQSQGRNQETAESFACCFAETPRFVYSRPGEGYAELVMRVVP